MSTGCHRAIQPTITRPSAKKVPQPVRAEGAGGEPARGGEARGEEDQPEGEFLAAQPFDLVPPHLEGLDPLGAAPFERALGTRCLVRPGRTPLDADLQVQRSG